MALYTIKDMADTLDVCQETIRKYIKKFQFVGIIRNNGKANSLVFPQTEFEMIRDTIEDYKVVEKNYYTTAQVAELAGVTSSCVSNIASRHKIHRIVRPAERCKIAYYPKESKDKVLEIIRQNEEKRLLCQHKKVVTEEKEINEAAALHPLVKDKRFLKLSYFPDVVPVCFKECEQ